MSVDLARRAAYDLLHEVAARDAYANLVWSGILDKVGVSGRDAAFATELAYGTLRWRGRYDAILSQCVDRPLVKLDGRLLDVLRLGVHQIVHMRVPDHAAVGESVDLARSVCGDGPAKMANAVLRKVTAKTPEEWVEIITRDLTGVDALSIEWSHPVWIVRALQQALAADGADPARIVDVLRADNEPARPTLVARPGRALVSDLLADSRVEPGRWSPYAATLLTGQPEELRPVTTGDVGVQDEGSQLVAIALSRASVDSDVRWLDLAAGPGGKAALLAGLARERGARLTAVEQHAHRAALVSRSVGPGVEVLVGDSTAAPWGAVRFDRTLADVPCTGIGALRRRPEARWRRTPSDLATLRPIQIGLLSAALDATRPGGVVAYSTCSPHTAETDLVVSDVLRGRTDVEQLDAREFLPGIPDLGRGLGVRLWPDIHGTDGMYLAMLRRR